MNDMALQEMDPVFMAGFAKLAQEEVDGIIEYCVKKDTAIDVRDLDKEVKTLLRPFQGWPKLLKEAEREVWRVNVFRLSVANTLVKREVHDGDGDNATISTFLVSKTTGRISEKNIAKILNLEVCLANTLLGVTSIGLMTGAVPTNFRPISPSGPNTEAILHNLDKCFSEARKVNFKIYNYGHLRPRVAGRPVVYAFPPSMQPTVPGTVLIQAPLPVSRLWILIEQIFGMHELLGHIGSNRQRHPHDLSAEFINGGGDGEMLGVKEFDGSLFSSYAGQVQESAHHTPTPRAHPQGFTVWDLLDIVRPLVGLDDSESRLTRADLETKNHQSNGVLQVRLVGEMLRDCDKAVVRFPSGPDPLLESQ